MPLLCAACEKTIKRNAYSWTIGWDRPEGYSKKAVSVRFHDDPKCLAVMAAGLETRSWEVGMMNAIDATADEDEADQDLTTWS